MFSVHPPKGKLDDEVDEAIFLEEGAGLHSQDENLKMDWKLYPIDFAVEVKEGEQTPTGDIQPKKTTKTFELDQKRGTESEVPSPPPVTPEGKEPFSGIFEDKLFVSKIVEKLKMLPQNQFLSPEPSPQSDRVKECKVKIAVDSRDSGYEY